MNKSITTFLFTIIFAVVISLPSVTAVIDKSNATVTCFDLNEDEKNENETLKDYEVKFISVQKNFCLLQVKKQHKLPKQTSNLYSNLLTDLISPPPEIL